jgi:lipopolysaccharide transport system permease protein
MLSPFQKIINLSTLIIEIARRDIIGRYKGSVLGLLWSLFNPLFMLVIYTFAFGFIFKAKWVGLNNDPFSFAIVLFPALMVFNFFNECVLRSTSIIISNPSYVKKVVFPLAILPLTISLSALFHFLVSFVVWCIANVILFGGLHLTVLLLPLALLPLILFSLACSWVLTSLGVYLRDIQQIIGVITSALIFLSPVFYPITSVPEEYRFLISANPLTDYVETIRGIMVFGTLPNLQEWLQSLLLASTLAFAGYWWFALTRKGFADVI